MSHAGSGKSRLGEIVLTNGPFAMKSRIEPLLEAGRAAGLLSFDDLADAFRSFFGLVVADTQIRALLGEGRHPDDAEIRAISARAVTKFLRLYGRG